MTVVTTVVLTSLYTDHLFGKLSFTDVNNKSIHISS